MRRRLHYFLLIALMIVSVCFAETVSVSAAKKISATISATSVKVGKTVQITTKLKNVTFTSSDEKIACVDADGTVSGKKPGTVTISIKKKGYQTKKFKITVKKNKKLPNVRVACDEILVTESLTDAGFTVTVKNDGLYKADKIVLTYGFETILGSEKKTYTVENLKKNKQKTVADNAVILPDVTTYQLMKIEVYAGDGLMTHNLLTDKYSYKYGTEDTKAPVFDGWVNKDSYKKGQVFMTVYAGQDFDYSRYVSVEDDRDAKVAFTVDTSKVDWKKTGVYKVYFTATDKAGNEATAYAKINVRLTTTEIDDMADQVLDDLIKDWWTDKKKTEAIYTYLRKYFSYVDHSDKSSWEKSAKYGLMYESGDCFTYYAAARILLTRAGIPNIMIKKVPGYSSNHWWNLVYINGGWYHFDTTPRKNQAMFCLLTDTQILSYSKKNGNCHDFNSDLYPDRAKKAISKLIYGKRY